MASFSSYLLVFFLASLIIIPQGFGSHPHDEKKHKPPSKSKYVHPTTFPELRGIVSPSGPNPTTTVPYKPPHNPPKEDDTHF